MKSDLDETYSIKSAYRGTLSHRFQVCIYKMPNLVGEGLENNHHNIVFICLFDCFPRDDCIELIVLESRKKAHSKGLKAQMPCLSNKELYVAMNWHFLPFYGPKQQFCPKDGENSVGRKFGDSQSI